MQRQTSQYRDNCVCSDKWEWGSIYVLLYLAQTLPLLSLATSGRMRASVLSACSSFPSCSVWEAILKLGKKKASSLLACSMFSLPCTALDRAFVPYCARKLSEARGEKGEKSRWLHGWCSSWISGCVWAWCQNLLFSFSGWSHCYNLFSTNKWKWFVIKPWWEK